jgi:hypothetical protein
MSGSMMIEPCPIFTDSAEPPSKVSHLSSRHRVVFYCRHCSFHTSITSILKNHLEEDHPEYEIEKPEVKVSRLDLYERVPC